MIRSIFAALSCILLLAGANCSKKGSDPQPGPPSCIYQGVDTCRQASKTTISVNLNSVKQTIHSFGASDCWTTKFIGKWNDVQKKNQIADLLFSIDTTSDGSPKGIGLSMWRFNIGAGSYEQGDTSDILTDWRREECFLNADGTYNWQKQQGQQWFLQAARQRGVAYSLGFAISPPVYMTQNNRAAAFNVKGNKLNIQDGKMGAFADFLAQVTQHFQFNFISPVNEPQWAWGGAQSAKASQEGSQAENTELAELARLLSQKLSAAGSTAKAVIAEAGQWNFLYGNNNDGRGDQIAQFFSSSSQNYIGNLPNVAHAISAHSYFTTCPDDNMVSVRQQVAAKVNQVDPSLETWQSEFGILGNICNQYNGSPRSIGIDYGLYVAKTIHHDLTIANVTSWQWWLAVSPYNYSDALVYINSPSGAVNENQCRTDGIVLDSKQLWSMGNYSRFIRPGMKRVGVSVQGITDPVTAAGKLMVSAYKDETAKKLVLVILNPGGNSQTLQLTGEGGALNIAGNSMNAYTTDNNSSLKKSVISTSDFSIPGHAIVTLTGNYQ